LTPGFEDRVLKQALGRLAALRVKAVGIFGTDPRDIVFLARLVRKHCPDARLFTVNADLTFLETESVADLRGMLVASTYPLHPANHEWVRAEEDTGHEHFFPNNSAQGVFNAAVIHVSELHSGKPDDHLSEYLMPHPLRAPGEPPPAVPPVWISVVGERGLHPVDCRQQPPQGAIFPLADRLKTVNQAAPPLIIRVSPAWVLLVISVAVAMIVYGWKRGAFRRLWPLAMQIVREDSAHTGVTQKSRTDAPNNGAAPPPNGAPPSRAQRAVVNAPGERLEGSTGVSAKQPPRGREERPIAMQPVASRAPSSARTAQANGSEARAAKTDTPEPAKASPRSEVKAAVLGASREDVRRALDAAPRVLFHVVLTTGLLFMASPLFGDVHLKPYLVYWVMVAAVVPALLAMAAAAWAERAERGLAAWADFVLVVLLFVAFVLQRFDLMSKDLRGWWLLSLDRGVAVTDGVSPYLPTSFLLCGFTAWFAAREHVASVGKDLGLGRGDTPGGKGTRPDRRHTYMVEIGNNRVRFDALFGTPSAGRPRWETPQFTALLFLCAVLIDVLLLRELPGSDEGRVFDCVFRAAFGVLLALLAWNTARLWSAWDALRCTLWGFARAFDRAFDRIPRSASSWLHLSNCKKEYATLIGRQTGAARKAIDRLRRAPEAMPTGDEERKRLAAELNQLERDLDRLKVNPHGTPNDKQRGDDLRAIRSVAAYLSRRWDERPVAPQADEPAEGKAANPPAWACTDRDSEEELRGQLEVVIALHCARWLGGAMARVWALVTGLVVMAFGLLFAVTSYPFPQQTRVMTLIGLPLAALAAAIIRVVFGTSRDEVLTRIKRAAPGKITWDESLFLRLFTFILPLLGFVAAVSTTMLDLIRSVADPILRLVH
jgi:hypothetical protein